MASGFRACAPFPFLLQIVEGCGAPADSGGGDLVDAAQVDAPRAPDAGPGLLALTVMTFNTGAGAKASDGSSGWSKALADTSNTYYGNGLAWNLAVEGTRQFFAALQPDIVHFQEIFYSGDCPSVPLDARAGFVCESWVAGDPTVAQVVLGPDYQIACTSEKTDTCVAVKRSVGTFHGCALDVCLDGMVGKRIDNCGRAHVGRGVIDLTAGGTLTVVNVHATSGFTLVDADCRKKEIDQIFLDLDGSPAANGARNFIMGDFNADPYRTSAFDPSASRLGDFIGANKPFHYITDEGLGATPTYGGFSIIDHVISDTSTGACRVPGVTPGLPPVLDFDHFDHHPIICDVTTPAN